MAEIPALLSRSSLVRMGDCVNFSTNELILAEGGKVKLIGLETGHLELPFTMTSVGNSTNEGKENIFTIGEDAATEEQLRRLHIHLGHREKELRLICCAGLEDRLVKKQ